MIRTQIYLPDDMHSLLHHFAKEEGTNISTLIRQGAEKIISEKKKKNNKADWKKFAGSIQTDTKTNSVEDIHDYYVNEIV